MKKVFPDLPKWVFEMDEVSAGVYEVVARDALGHYTSVKGTDLDELVKKCKHEAARLEQRNGGPA